MTSSQSVTVTPIKPANAQTSPRAHHVGNPPTSFKNPWPSYRGSHSLVSVLRTRFSSERNFVPVPSTRDELVGIRTPDWGSDKPGLKATWFGHASFLIETSKEKGASRGIRILVDPVFSDCMSPFSFVGPKRFSPLPCALDEVPDVDLVVISHNHYDHLDLWTIKEVYKSRKGKVHFLCALNLKTWFLGCGISDHEVTELDWWDEAKVNVEGIGSVKLACTPAQHMSARTAWDTSCTLWCSWVLEELEMVEKKRLYFAGDTAYRTVTSADPPEEHASLPVCPAFAEIGQRYGPFDLALLPIGCFLPRSFMSAVHCAPEDSIKIHKDIRSKKSIGMHYGTIRGGLSAQFEDVREPVKQWKKSAEAEGLKWGEEICICDIGETVVV